MSHVLIIEDNDLNLTLMQAILNANDISFDSAVTGTAGVELALSHSYGAVLMDLQLPDIDGFAALALIRESSNVPVIAVTGNATDADEMKAKQAGFHAFIRKPFRIDDLLHLLKPLLAHNHKKNG